MLCRMYPVGILLALVLVWSATADDGSSSSSEYLNVYGKPLESCSQDGMALTGWTRTGYCVDLYGDSGSHHICIDLSSLGGSDGNHQNFCAVTGQSDWCDYTDMPCHSDPSQEACPVVDWCVCQWAFASYIQAAGGCDNIQTIVCEAVNRRALLAYQQQVAAASSDSDRAKFADAMNCLVDRCGLDESYRYESSSSGSFLVSSVTGGSPGRFLAHTAAMAALLVGAVASVRYYRNTVAAKTTIHLNPQDAEMTTVKDTPANAASTLL